MDTFDPNKEDLYNEVMAAERAVLAACLRKPANLQIVESLLRPEDLMGSLHRQVFTTLVAVAAEGRTPSIEAVTAVHGEEEVAPNVTLRKYLRDIVVDSTAGIFLPIEDAVEVVLDKANRRRVAEIGSHLQQSSELAVRISDLAAHGVEALDAILADARRGRRLSYDAGEAGDAAMKHLDGTDRPYPTTGLIDLDYRLGGWPLGQLSVLAGRPGAGKSAVASTMLWRAAEKGNAAAFFSLEMTKEQLGARLLTDISYVRSHPVEYQDILNRKEIDQHRRKLLAEGRDRLAALPINIEEQRGLTVSEIAARSRKIASERARENRPLKLIFVDHMMLVRSTDRYSGNRVREVGEISEGLTHLAQELDVAIVALCQLNRNVEGRDNKRATLSDLRDSGEVEQNASTVTFLYRPAYYLEMEKFDDTELEAMRKEKLEQLRNTLELNVAKNRNGMVGLVTAFVDIGSNAVRNADFDPNVRVRQ